MRRRAALLAFFVLAGSSLPPGSAAEATDDPVGRLLTQLARPSVLRARFVQEKHLAALERPVIARGRFTATREGELIWRIDAPLQLTYVFSRAGLFELDASGLRKRPGTNSDRVQQEIGRLVAALLAADLDTLRQRFHLRVEGDPARWRAQLTPRGAPLSAFLIALDLQGRTHVERIHVTEASGDSITITLSEVQTPAALSAEESALLQGS